MPTSVQFELSQSNPADDLLRSHASQRLTSNLMKRRKSVFELVTLIGRQCEPLGTVGLTSEDRQGRNHLRKICAREARAGLGSRPVEQCENMARAWLVACTKDGRINRQ